MARTARTRRERKPSRTASAKPAPKKSKSINKRELAALIGVSVTAVDGWIARGCPAIERGGLGRRWRFDPDAVRAWLESRRHGRTEHALRAQQIRLARARADRIELDLAIKREDIVDARDVEAALSEEYSKLREQLLSIPDRAASHFPAADRDRVREILVAILRASLDALSPNGDGG
ncbi:MAG: hypothetical protein A2V88_00625 [Elusimicrobia bacterium RBG_16_66_12]|nr:MAG: hypothetical protein A2V88_00625 [Elusimicrobia bacterium RBG_16_66_12]